MKRWVELIGHRFDLEELKGFLDGGPYAITEEEGQFFLSSDRFNEIESAGAVRSAAQNLIGTLNGLARIRSAEFRNVSVGDVKSEDSTGRRTFHAFVSDAITVRGRATARVVFRNGHSAAPQEGGELNLWLGVADADPRVRQALDYLNGPETTWNDLYRAVEVVESDVGGIITEAGWASRTALSRFKRTANSHAALGPDARHGTDDTEPPPKPMTFTEAFELVRNIHRQWLDYRCGI